MRVIVELLDQDGGHDPAADVERNRLHLSKLMNGLMKVDLELTGEQALLFEHGVNQRADELFHQYKTDEDVSSGTIEVPGRATLMALAVIDLVRRGQAVNESSTVPPKPEVTFVARAEEPTRFCDDHGHTLPDGTVVTVCCDPDIWSVIVNSFGVPLDLGRKQRRATNGQRRAMAIRDGGCTFPGCSSPPAWTDVTLPGLDGHLGLDGLISGGGGVAEVGVEPFSVVKVDVSDECRLGDRSSRWDAEWVNRFALERGEP